MKSSEIWYIDERAEQLAIVYITRHADLSMLPASEDNGAVDYLVRIRHADTHVKRVFGVQVIGVLTRDLIKTTSVPTVNRTVHTVAADAEELLPICELLFVMETDEGFYRWVDEPTITAAGQASLQHSADPTYYSLDSDALDNIVAMVNRWYDAHS
jgi:hypothetical protein